MTNTLKDLNSGGTLDKRALQIFFFMTRDKKTLLRTSITNGTHYMAPSCNGPDVAVLPNNVGSGRSGTIAPTTCPHFQQRRRERPGTAACQDCPPSHEPRCPCTGLLGHRFRPSSVSHQTIFRPPRQRAPRVWFPKLPCQLGIGLKVRAISLKRCIVCACIEGFFLCWFVQFVSHDLLWGKTGNGSWKTSCRRLCGGQS